MPELHPRDLLNVIRHTPADIRTLMIANPGRLFLGGGFIRAIIAGEKPSDIDLFGPNHEFLQSCANSLKGVRRATNLHTTKNAITVISGGRITVQFITRWVFDDPIKCSESFDFTICKAIIWYDEANKVYKSHCPPGYYYDLAAKRLTYTFPEREEEAGGSLMRALKFTRRGYYLSPHDLAAVVSRLTAKVRWSVVEEDPKFAHNVLAGLIREVDPALALDGIHVTDDGENPIDGLEYEDNEDFDLSRFIIE